MLNDGGWGNGSTCGLALLTERHFTKDQTFGVIQHFIIWRVFFKLYSNAVETGFLISALLRTRSSLTIISNARQSEHANISARK